MDLYEYQAKTLLQDKGIPVPPFAVFSTLLEYEEVITKLNLNAAVLKVQVLASGRGKGGGVKFAQKREEALEYAKKLLGMRFINKQTAKEGVVVDKVIISAPLKLKNEFYIGFLIDREIGKAILIVSREGGMEIEEVAKNHPQKILKIPLDGKEIKENQLLKICHYLGWSQKVAFLGKKIISQLYAFFNEKDVKMIEINPLGETQDGKLLVIDAKLSIDDNALFRQKEIATFADKPVSNFSYVSLKGNIGCMVNGAGLAMATMDIIHDFGGYPANFLDLGGSATEEKITEGFKLIFSDPKVKGIFINIFGGIMNSLTVAAAIIQAIKEVSLNVPLVLRMEGTESLAGKAMILNSGLKIELAEDMADGAKKIVEMVNGDNAR